ncbi:4Fe-4S binding protein [Clostridium ganghwense]|uniref:4Fe-4S binding protein n=1 Tax=Clostridium ganghwense TaxID=312089 RepID=A0ABT4CMB4_9CLOT|nr:4Fe-4S binding protein [Clostridium ganghwense]MCY6370194.1 4Fe-4S binding protein [Clostridium ganghwense]
MIIIFLSLVLGRFFCGWLCPLGTVQALLSKIKFIKLVRNDNTCGSCRLCTTNCPMGINTSQLNVIKSGECIGCLKCVRNCSKSNFKIDILKQKIHPIVYMLVGLTVFTSIYSYKYINDIQVEAKQEVQVQKSIKEGSGNVREESASKQDIKQETNNLDKIENKMYNDGIYTGVSVGRRPELTVKVTIKNDKITSIEIVKHKESKEYSKVPFQVIPKKIISAQSVDAVSGDTNTSTSARLIKAIEDAVKKAKKGNINEE